MNGSDLDRWVRTSGVALLRRARPDHPHVLFELWDGLCAVARRLEAEEGSSGRLGANVGEIAVVGQILTDEAHYLLLYELIGTFDLVEALGSLLLLATDRGDIDALTTAARLAGGPGASPSWRDHVIEAARLAELSSDEMTAIAVLMDPTAELDTSGVRYADLKFVRDHRWPHDATAANLAAPIALFVTEGFPSTPSLIAMGDLVASGYLVRRAPKTEQESIRSWLGPAVLVVGDTPASVGEVLNAPADDSWDARVRFVEAACSASQGLGFARETFELDRFARARSFSDEQYRSALALLHVDGPSSAYAVSDDESFWSGPINAMLRAEHYESVRERDFHEVALGSALAILSELGTGFEIDIAPILERIVDQMQPSVEDRDRAAEGVRSAVEEVLGELPSDKIHYIDGSRVRVDPH